MNRRNLLRAAFAFAAVMMLCASAEAGLFRAYVSSNGNDANPCTLPAPCRLLPAALAAVNPGGEIWMLDSANFNVSQVDITKSVTILAIPGAVGSIVATGGGHGINMNAPAGVVTLRNLVIVSLGSSADGIVYATGAQLVVEDCEISNVGGNGITMSQDHGELVVKNTTIRNTGYALAATAGNGHTSLDHVHIVGTGISVTAGYLAVTDSLLEGAGTAVYAIINGGGAVQILLERTRLVNCSYGLWGQTSLSGDQLDVMLKGNVISGGGGYAVQLNNLGTALHVVLDDNTITHQYGGVLLQGGAIVYTRGNNTLKYMGAGGDVSGGTLTALAGQ